MPLQTDKQKVAHLLRRFGLGASEAELDYYGKDGLSGAIQRLLDYKSLEESFVADPAMLFPQGNVNGNPRFSQTYWYAEFIATPRVLEKKMSLFWHDHFAVSAQKVDSGGAMHDYSRLLMENSTGNFMRFLENVSKSPAMLYWLDNQENVKGRPNENFAREVMELFTMGVDNGYTERDIAEAARAFTGWTVGFKRGQRTVPVRNQIPRANAVFYFDRVNHDDGTKTLLGNTGDWTGDEALGLIAAKAQTSEYITRKMWEWFGYPQPEKSLVERLAKKFRDSGMEISVLVRAIMESSEFYSEKAERAIIKNPVDFVIPIMRELGLGQFILQRIQNLDPDATNNRGVLAPAALAIRATTGMGMELMYPPDVSGWGSGQEWISTATMVERIKFADVMFGNPSAGGQSLRVPMYSLFQSDPTPVGIVNRMISLLDANVPEVKKKTLQDAAAEQGKLTARNANAIAHTVGRLIFGSPEFQLS